MKVEFQAYLTEELYKKLPPNKYQEYVAERLALSLMLIELGIDRITIDDKIFNLNTIRKRNNRFRT